MIRPCVSNQHPLASILDQIQRLVDDGHIDLSVAKNALHQIIAAARIEFTVSQTRLLTGKKTGPFQVEDDCLYPTGRLQAISLVQVIKAPTPFITFDGLRKKAKETSSFLGLAHADAFIGTAPVASRLFVGKVILFPGTTMRPHQDKSDESYIPAVRIEENRWEIYAEPIRNSWNKRVHGNFYLMSVYQKRP